jgi:hypothetical protein
MSGDWIKLRCDLRSDPAVFKLAELTKLDRFSVVGRLAEFWIWIDKHSVDGRVDGGTSTAIDDVVGCSGFVDALIKVKWIVVDANGVYIPKHEQHNSDSAKERTLKNERQARWRAKKAAEAAAKLVDAGVGVSASTREEKRREEKKTPKVPKGTDRRFEDFWLSWPKGDRKQDKGKCHDLWVEKGLDAAADVILADVKAKRGTAKWREGFIEAPMVYLRNRRWEDRGLDLDGAADRCPTWCAAAGFVNIHEAGNSGCYEHTAEQFHDGKRVEEHA